MAQNRKPPPKRVVRTTTRKSPAGQFETRAVKVRSHARRTASGKQTTVRSHSRTLSDWQQAGAAWAGAGAAGLTSLGMVVTLGFTLVSTICLLLTVLLGGLASMLTSKASAPRRRMRAKVAAKPRARRR